MRLNIPFDNTYAALDEVFFSRVNPVAVKDPTLIAYNAELAKEIGITSGTEDEHAKVFSGTRLAKGTDPLAQLMPAISLAIIPHNWGTGARSYWAKPAGPTTAAGISSSKGLAQPPIRAAATDAPGWVRCCANI